MKKEDIAVITQLLTTMKEVSEKLENALLQKDFATVSRVKKELMDLQKQVDKLL